MREETYRYWGLYCPQHNIWVTNTDGMMLQFDAPSIAQALLEASALYPFQAWKHSHLWEVTEFGQQKPVDASILPTCSFVCPEPQRAAA